MRRLVFVACLLATSLTHASVLVPTPYAEVVKRVTRVYKVEILERREEQTTYRHASGKELPGAFVIHYRVKILDVLKGERPAAEAFGALVSFSNLTTYDDAGNASGWKSIQTLGSGSEARAKTGETWLMSFAGWQVDPNPDQIILRLDEPAKEASIRALLASDGKAGVTPPPAHR